MKFAVPAALSISLALTAPAFASAPQAPAKAAASNPAHVKAVQDLLSAMQAEKVLRGVAFRSRYTNEALRKEVLAKLDKVPAAEVHKRLAAPLTRAISAETATEMTRFYLSPYGKQVIHRKYNSGPEMMFPGMKKSVPKEEQKERRRAAYVKASKELEDAERTIQHEAFKLLQLISKEKR